MDTLTGKTFAMTDHENTQFEVVSENPSSVYIRWHHNFPGIKKNGKFGRYFFVESVRRGFFEEIV